MKLIIIFIIKHSQNNIKLEHFHIIYYIRIKLIQAFIAKFGMLNSPRHGYSQSPIVLQTYFVFVIKF